jgi:hypothetical protein
MYVNEEKLAPLKKMMSFLFCLILIPSLRYSLFLAFILRGPFSFKISHRHIICPLPLMR